MSQDLFYFTTSAVVKESVLKPSFLLTKAIHFYFRKVSRDTLLISQKINHFTGFATPNVKYAKKAKIKTAQMRNSYPLCRNGFRRFARNFSKIPLKKPKGIRGTRHLRFAPVVGKADAPEPADAVSPRFAGSQRTVKRFVCPRPKRGN